MQHNSCLGRRVPSPGPDLLPHHHLLTVTDRHYSNLNRPLIDAVVLMMLVDHWDLSSSMAHGPWYTFALVEVVGKDLSS